MSDFHIIIKEEVSAEIFTGDEADDLHFIQSVIQ